MVRQLLLPAVFSLALAQASSISVTACAQSFSTFPTDCETNATGALANKSTNAASGGSFTNSSQASASASVTSYGQLGVAASTHWNNPGNASLRHSALSNATVNDRLFFSALPAGTISLTFDISGLASGSSVGVWSGSSVVQFSSIAFNYQRFVWSFIGDGRTSGSTISQTVPLSSVTVTAPFSNGQLAFDLTFGTSVRVDNAALLDVDMNFLSTATLSLVQVRDSLGNLIVDPGITAESGFRYDLIGAVGGGSEVPEPASITLALAGGLALLASRAASRKS